MKKSRLLILASIGLMVLTGLLNFFGCSREESTLAPEPKIAFNPSELHILAFPVSREEVDLNITRGIVPYVEEWVSAEEGGVLQWRFNVKLVKVELKFEVMPHSLSESTLIRIGLTNGLTIPTGIDMTFGPSGTLFEPAAKLEIDARGLTLFGIDPARVGLFYYNEEEGHWEPVEADVKVDLGAGRVQVIANIAHFSRYAIAWGE